MNDDTRSAGSEDDRFAPDIPSTVELELGVEVRWRLASAAGAGYLWEVQDLDSSGTAEASVERDEERSASRDWPDDRPSSEPVPLVLVIRGVSRGTSRLRLRLLRPWAPDPPLVDRTLEVVVRP